MELYINNELVLCGDQYHDKIRERIYACLYTLNWSGIKLPIPLKRDGMSINFDFKDLKENYIRFDHCIYGCY
jgi:hypothetical protein